MTKQTLKELLEYVHKHLSKGKAMYVANSKGAELHITLLANERNELVFDWFPTAKSYVVMCFSANYIDEKTGEQDWISSVYHAIPIDLEDTDWRLISLPKQHI